MNKAIFSSCLVFSILCPLGAMENNQVAQLITQAAKTYKLHGDIRYDNAVLTLADKQIVHVYWPKNLSKETIEKMLIQKILDGSTANLYLTSFWISGDPYYTVEITDAAHPLNKE